MGRCHRGRARSRRAPSKWALDTKCLRVCTGSYGLYEIWTDVAGSAFRVSVQRNEASTI